MKRTIYWSFALLIAAAGAAQADVISTTNVTEFTDPLPGTIGNDSFNGEDLTGAYYFPEAESHKLAAALGGSDPDGFLGDPIPADTLVDSYLLFLDPVTQQTVTNIQMTFDSRILGVFGDDATLADTDFLGRPGQTYGDWSGLVGLERGEEVSLSGDFHSLDIKQLSASTPGDYVRIVTLARPSDVIPEPATMTLLGSGLALAAVARRLRRN